MSIGNKPVREITYSCRHDYFVWDLSVNEEGWRCPGCDHKPGEPPGYSPQLDREAVHEKVEGILFYLHDADFVHVSNGSEGDEIAGQVANRCRQTGRYDQYSILGFLVALLAPSHAQYWSEVGQGVLSGNDPRHRCQCGALANCSRGFEYFCDKHHPGY